MRPNRWDVKFTAYLYKTLRQIELGDIATGIAPEHIPAILFSDLHSGIEQLDAKLLPAVFLIRSHTAKLELPRARDICMRRLIERADRYDAIAIEDAKMIGRRIIIAR